MSSALVEAADTRPATSLAALKEMEALGVLYHAIEQATDAIIITDSEIDLPGPRILYVNPAFLTMTGYTAEEVLGQTPRILQGPNTDRAILTWLRHCLGEGIPFFGQGINYRKGGQIYQAEWRITPLRTECGDITHFMACIRDVTEHQRYEEQIGNQLVQIHEYSQQLEIQKAALERANTQLRALATTDGLTGLSNHRDFHEQLEHELQRAMRYATSLSLILLDVDRFKQYNDAFGHPAGDEVLKTVSDLLRKQARAADLVSRYGGEEFAVLLPATAKEEALAVAERLRAEIEAYPWPGRPVTISLGVSSLSMEGTQEARLLEEADKALYQSKGTGRNRTTHFWEITTDRRRIASDELEFTWPYLTQFPAIGTEAETAEPDLTDGMRLTA